LEAYNESSDKSAIVVNKLPADDLAATREFILQRLDFIAENFRLDEVLTSHLRQKFAHLETLEAFSLILPRHQEIENKVLFEKGSAAFVDHTILKADATARDIDVLCDDAKTNSFAAVCVNGGRSEQAVNILKNTSVDVAAVVGFPLGACTTRSKVYEALELYRIGVEEIDFVIDVGKIKDKNYLYVFDSLILLAKITKAQREPKRVTKVILECCLLTKEEIVDASLLCALAGINFVKTSTGFSHHGATLEHVQLMKLTVGNSVLVKAAGGVRDKEGLIAMINSGASRIGTSSGLKLIISPSEARVMQKKGE